MRNISAAKSALLFPYLPATGAKIVDKTVHIDGDYTGIYVHLAKQNHAG